MLVANAGNPLANAQGITDPAQRAARPSPPSPRRFIWTSIRSSGTSSGSRASAAVWSASATSAQHPADQQSVNGQLGRTRRSPFKLIAASIILAIFLGIAIGIVTALRQYSGLDYTVTFFAFLFFSLPVFWIGVVLKDLFAIRFNTFLQSGAALTWARPSS